MTGSAASVRSSVPKNSLASVKAVSVAPVKLNARRASTWSTPDTWGGLANTVHDRGATVRAQYAAVPTVQPVSKRVREAWDASGLTHREKVAMGWNFADDTAYRGFDWHPSDDPDYYNRMSRF